MMLDENLFEEVKKGDVRGPYKKKELSDQEIFDKVFDKLQAKLISKHYKIGTDGNYLFVNARVVNKKLPNGRVVIRREFLTDKKDYEDIIKYLDEANVKHEFKDSVQGLQLNILLDKDNAKDVNQEVLNRNVRVKNEDLPANRFKLKRYNDNSVSLRESSEQLFTVELYDNSGAEPTRERFNSLKKAAEFAETKTDGSVEDIYITKATINGPSILNHWHNKWYTDLDETYEIVNSEGKKIPQGGGFTSRKEAEMFAAQYGEKDLKVVKESTNSSDKLVAKYYVPHIYKEGSDIDTLTIYQYEDDGDTWYSYKSNSFGSEEGFESQNEAYQAFQNTMDKEFMKDWGLAYEVVNSKAYADKLIASWEKEFADDLDESIIKTSDGKEVTKSIGESPKEELKELKQYKVKPIKEDLNTFDYDKLQRELQAIPNVTKIDFDKDLIYDTKELVVLVNWHSDSDTAQWFKDKIAVKTKAIEVFKNNGLKLSDPVEDNGDYYYFVLREITPKAESLKESNIDPHILRFITNHNQSLFILPKQLKYYNDIVKLHLPENSEVTGVIDYITPLNNKVFVFEHKEDFPDLKKSKQTLDMVENGKYSVEDALKLTDLESSPAETVVTRYPKNQGEVISMSKMPDYAFKMFDNNLNQLNGFGFQDKNGYTKILFEEELSKEEIEKLAKEYLEDKHFELFDGKSNTYYNNESLKEDLSQEDKSEYGLTTLINSLIKDELEAIDGYNSAIVTLEAENKGEFTDVIRSIIDDEQNHIGNLQEILNRISPGTEQELDKGKAEAEEMLKDDRIEE